MMLMGPSPLISAMILLTVAFFVLVTVARTQSKALRIFGRILAILLCILAGLSIIASIYCGITGKSCKGIWKFPLKSRLEQKAPEGKGIRR
jgi:uncharacterized membrane protein